LRSWDAFTWEALTTLKRRCFSKTPQGALPLDPAKGHCPLDSQLRKLTILQKPVIKVFSFSFSFLCFFLFSFFFFFTKKKEKEKRKKETDL